MFDVSDETTGLPPLTEISPESSLLALQWMVGASGIITTGEREDGQPTDTMPVRYLSVRGYQLDNDGEPCYAQIHIAVPTEALPGLLEAWNTTLEDA